MKTAITLSQVPDSVAGPFVLRSPLPDAFAAAVALRFDAVELFLPSADFIAVNEVKTLVAANGLSENN